MGWIALALIGGVTVAALWLSGIARARWWLVGAALMLGAVGYALQGRPLLGGAPVRAFAAPIEVDADLVELRRTMLGRYTADTAYLTAADAIMASGDTRSAVWVTLAGLDKYPDSMPLWTGLGSALAVHDGDTVSPAALFAFTRAARLAPRHPGPPFFLGIAYVRAGEFAAARDCWARALRLTPAGLSYRVDIAERLALLDQYLAMVSQGAGR